jgi:hypothetical protein
MKFIAIALCSFLIIATISCQEEIKETKAVPQKIQVKSEILVEKSEVGHSRSSQGSYSFGYSPGGILNELFEEEVDKNPNLELLLNKISDIDEKRRDSTEYFVNFDTLFSDYLFQVRREIKHIKDTVYAKRVSSVFDEFENIFKRTKNKHRKFIGRLDNKKSTVNDKLVLMKLMISLKKMTHFLENEIPSIDELRKLGKEYDALIKETEPYTKIQ